MTSKISVLFRQPYLLLMLTMLMWGGNAVAGRLAVGELSPMVLTSLRWALSCSALAIFANRHMATDWPAIRAKPLIVILMGFFGFTAFNALFYVAAHYTSAINLTLLQGAIPAIVLLGGLLVFRTPVRGVQAIGMIVTLIGVAVVASGGHLERLAQLDLNFGDLLMLIASLFYAGYTIVMPNRPQASALGLFAFMAIVAFLTSLPLLASEIIAGKALWPHSIRGWLVLLYVAFCPSMLAQIFYIRAIELIGPGRAGIFINLVPVFGALFGVVMLGENFGWHHAIAFILVLGGIMLAERKKG